MQTNIPGVSGKVNYFAADLILATHRASPLRQPTRPRDPYPRPFPYSCDIRVLRLTRGDGSKEPRPLPLRRLPAASRPCLTEYITGTVQPSYEIPFAVTVTSEAPGSASKGTVNCVDSIALPVATPIVE